MTMGRRIIISIFTFHLCVQSVVAVTCFGVANTPFRDNKICPGSKACCGSTATCLPNRLCHNAGDNPGLFVRGPCSVQPYSLSSCAQICLYNETTLAGLLPRVNLCSDGSYCCANDPQCCVNKRGLFLNDSGDIVSSLPSSTASSTPQSSTSSASTTFFSTISSSTSNSPPDSGEVAMTTLSTTQPTASPPEEASGLATGVKIGLGVAIPLGILILAALGTMIWFFRRRAKRAEAKSKIQYQNLQSEQPPEPHVQQPDVHEIGTGAKWSTNVHAHKPLPELEANSFVAELPANR